MLIAVRPIQRNNPGKIYSWMPLARLQAILAWPHLVRPGYWGCALASKLQKKYHRILKRVRPMGRVMVNKVSETRQICTQFTHFVIQFLPLLNFPKRCVNLNADSELFTIFAASSHMTRVLL